MRKEIHFWYEFASPFSCLTAFRIEDLAKEKKVEINWHPFLLGAVFKKLDLLPPAQRENPFKDSYLWHDAKRTAETRGILFGVPSQFPRVSVLSARIALAGRDQGWCPEFSKRVFEANFIHDLDIAKPRVNEYILSTMGLDAKAIMAQAQSDEIKSLLRKETDEAFEKQIFGVPMFFAGKDVFWGDDRLEAALGGQRPVNS